MKHRSFKSKAPVNREERRRERKAQVEKWRWQYCPICHRRYDAWALARLNNMPFIGADGHHFTPLSCDSAKCIAELITANPHLLDNWTEEALLNQLGADGISHEIAPRLRAALNDLFTAAYLERVDARKLSPAAVVSPQPSNPRSLPDV